jgi:hypothetical protein
MCFPRERKTAASGKWRRSGAKREFYDKWSLSRKAQTDICLAKSLVKLRLILFDGCILTFLSLQIWLAGNSS